jgi:hypothetical protein
MFAAENGTPGLMIFDTSLFAWRSRRIILIPSWREGIFRDIGRSFARYLWKMKRFEKLHRGLKSMVWMGRMGGE